MPEEEREQIERELSEYVREQFPSLQNKINGCSIAYLDGPGGYQVPSRVIKGMEEYLININANAEGSFYTSRKTDEMLENAREVFSDFFNCSREEVAFGANMTTLSFILAQALMREMKLGDKVIITEIDHEGNRAPWLELRERGIIVDEVPIDVNTCTLKMDDFERKLLRNTKVVAVNYASNAVGTISDVNRIVRMAHEVGAYTIVDAVHYAAHRPIDVQEIGTDFLVCSAYKFFGPHVGVIYAKKDVLSKLRTMQVRPARHYPPYRIETGTLNHEGIAGAAEAVKFVADIGARFGHTKKLQQSLAGLQGHRRNIVAGLLTFESYEQQLTDYLLNELSTIQGVRIYGPPEGHLRTSTTSFTYAGYAARDVAQYLDSKGILVWDGDFFATTLVERLGLLDQGGLVRIGIAPYNTREELRRLIDSLNDTAALKTFVSTKP